MSNFFHYKASILKTISGAEVQLVLISVVLGILASMLSFAEELSCYVYIQFFIF